MGALVISDAQLRALTHEQRAHLARRLAALGAHAPAAARTTATDPATPVDPMAPAPERAASSQHRRRWLAVIAFSACVAMIPWTVMLAGNLPDRYVTLHWSTTWVGFDSLMIVSFAVTGLLTWRRHRARWAAALVTATLLACDAWFDVSTASTVTDLAGSAITAALGELPLAALLIYLSVRGREPSSPGGPRPASAEPSPAAA